MNNSFCLSCLQWRGERGGGLVPVQQRNGKNCCDAASGEKGIHKASVRIHVDIK